MKNILTILSSAKGAESISTKLARAIVDKLQIAHPESVVTERDLAKKPVPQLGSVMAGVPTREGAMSLTDELLAELKQADTIVIGLGLYNYGIPSSLKAWIDEICRAGITFYYNEQGAQVGLLKDKTVYLAMASGGIFSSGPLASWDHAIPYLKTMFASIGITDVVTYRAEGMGIPAIRATALQLAIDAITI